MPERIDKEEHSIDPVHLDSNQMQELDKLIGSLKKEIVHPQKRKPEQSASSGVGHN
jgi:hypothetical protein